MTTDSLGESKKSAIQQLLEAYSQNVTKIEHIEYSGICSYLREGKLEPSSQHLSLSRNGFTGQQVDGDNVRSIKGGHRNLY